MALEAGQWENHRLHEALLPVRRGLSAGGEE